MTNLFSPGTLLLVATSLAIFAPNSMNLNINVNASKTVEVGESNPLIQKWTGPYGGLPPFDKVKVADFKPAMETAMAANLVEIEKIAGNTNAPTFENTIVAMERSGHTLVRLQALYGVWSSTMSDTEFQAVETEMEPRLAAFSDQIVQNPKLFARIEAVYNSPKDKLTHEQQRLTWLYYTNFVRAGAKLNAASKERLSQINQQLAGLFTKFTQNLLFDEMNQYLVLESEKDLEGLTQSIKDAAAAAATNKKLAGKWVIANTRSSVEPFLKNSSRRDLREKAWRMFVSRGDNGGEHDNNAIITEILQLRMERAKLLGYETHAHWRLENSMAKTPGVAMRDFDPVSYHKGKPTKGTSTFSFMYKSIEYYFTNAENLEAFKKAPAKYEPAYGGWCAYSMAEGKKVKIDPLTYKIVNGKLFLFSNFNGNNTMLRWDKDEKKYKASADKNWEKGMN